MKTTQFAQNFHQLMLKSIISLVPFTFSTLIDHILLKRVIKVGLFDHQFIFCTGKICTFKPGGVHKYINFHSLKTYRVNEYKKNLRQLVFPYYEIFDNINVYSDFIQKIMTSIDKFAPYKTRQVKLNIQKWFA